jgi:hypothetical protein
MAEVVGFKLVLDGKEKVVSSIGEMKKLLKEANFELVAAQQNFGEYSQEAINAAKRVATLKDTIQEAKETSDLFDPGKKFQAFAGAISAVAGGFSAVQGALGLVGVESENVEKTLLKVQSALALSQGLSTIADAAKDFQRLNAIIQQTTIFQRANNITTATAVAVQRAFGVATVQTSVAFRVLKTAIAATGIGLLVVGLTALIGKIQDWTSASDKAAEAQKKLAKDTDFLNAKINNEIAILTSVGNKEDEIYRKRVQIANNELNVLRSAAKQKGELTQEEIKKFGELKTQLVTLEIDEKNRIKKVNEDAQKEKDKKDKEAADKAKAVAQERINANKEAEDQLRKLRQDAELNAIEDQNKRAIRQAEIDFENRKIEINALKASEQLKTQLITEEQKKRDATVAQLKQEAAQAELDAIFAQFEAQDAADKAEEERRKAAQDREVEARQIRRNRELAELEERKKTREEFQQAELEAERYLQDQKNALLDAGINFALALAGRNEKLANAIFAVQKAIEIGRIITTTTASITKIKADTFAIPAFVGPGLPNPLFVKALAVMGTKIAGLKIGAAASIASIAASSISKFKGGGGGSVGGTQDTGAAGGGGSAPLTPNAPIQNTVTQLDQATINRLGSASNRAYVVESDITNSQERITRINRAARLG